MTPSRRAIQLVLSLILALTGLMVLAPASQAALHNPIPMNSDEEPDDEFTDDDALFVYVTSDIRGGASRTVFADGTVFSSPGYTGSFAGSPSVQCSVE